MAKTPEYRQPTEEFRTDAPPETVERAAIPEMPSPEETCRLLNELQLLYVELETENKTLRRTQKVLEASSARYAALFELAPVGYLTLSSTGVILEANHVVAAMCGAVQNDLLDNEMSKFVFHEDRHVYYQHRKKVFKVNEIQVWEMRILQAGGSPFWARLQATLAHNGECWITMVDISERKQAEEKLRQWMWRAMPSVPEAAESVGPVC